jgi:hypothetical protein
VAEKKTGRAKHFSLGLKQLLRDAQALRSEKAGVNAREYRKKVVALCADLSRHLRDRVLSDPDNQTLLNGVGYQDDQGNLLRFLDRDSMEPTNNRAERELRPAAIARKLSHCSRTRRGADAFEAFTSVIQDAAKKESSGSTCRSPRPTHQPSPSYLPLSPGLANHLPSKFQTKREDLCAHPPGTGSIESSRRLADKRLLER